MGLSRLIAHRRLDTPIARNIAQQKGVTGSGAGEGGGEGLPVGGFVSTTGAGHNNCQTPGGSNLQRYFQYDNQTGDSLTFTLMGDSTAPGDLVVLFAYTDENGNVTGMVEGEVTLESGAVQNFITVMQFDPPPASGYTARIIASIGGTPTYALPLVMDMCQEREFDADFTLTSKDGSVPEAVEPNETLVFGLSVQTADGQPYDLNATVQMLCTGSTDYTTLLETSPPGGQAVGPHAVFWTEQRFAEGEVKQYSATFQMVADLTGLTEVSFGGSCAPEGGFNGQGGQLGYPPAPSP